MSVARSNADAAARSTGAYTKESVVYQCDDDAPARYVLVRAPSGRPLVLVGKSALLRKLHAQGKLDSAPGLGLFAARTIRANEVIGKYDGTHYGPFDTREEAMASADARRLRRSSTMLVAVRRSRQRGWTLVDGSTAAAPYIALANDPRGTRMKPNCVLTEYGSLRAIRNIPAFHPCDPIRSELLWDYGDGYWKDFAQKT